MADLVLYDGVCGLCNRLNLFILKRDARDRFQFASLQSSPAREILRRYRRDANDLDTVYVIADFGEKTERLLSKGRAVIHVLRSFGGMWRAARVLELLPAKVVDALYAFVARHRYRWFGRYETCAVPPPGYRAKFLDDPTSSEPGPPAL